MDKSPCSKKHGKNEPARAQTCDLLKVLIAERLQKHSKVLRKKRFAKNFEVLTDKHLQPFAVLLF